MLRYAELFRRAVETARDNLPFRDVFSPANSALAEK